MPESTPLPTVTKDKVLYYVTVYEFPKATVRHTVFVNHEPVEQITTFDRWVEHEAARIAIRTGMSFGIVHNAQGQLALAALKS